MTRWRTSNVNCVSIQQVKKLIWSYMSYQYMARWRIINVNCVNMQQIRGVFSSGIFQPSIARCRISSCGINRYIIFASKSNTSRVGLRREGGLYCFFHSTTVLDIVMTSPRTCTQCVSNEATKPSRWNLSIQLYVPVVIISDVEWNTHRVLPVLAASLHVFTPKPMIYSRASGPWWLTNTNSLSPLPLYWGDET